MICRWKHHPIQLLPHAAISDMPTPS